MGPFPYRPGLGGLVRGQRRQTHPGRLGQGLCAVPRAHGPPAVRCRRHVHRQRTVQPRCDARDLPLQRRSPHLERVRAALDAAEVQTALRDGPAITSSLATPSAPTSRFASPPCSIWRRASSRAWTPRCGLPAGSTKTTSCPMASLRARSSSPAFAAFRCTETCDVIASIWSNIWLYRITGALFRRQRRAGILQRGTGPNRQGFPDDELLSIAQSHPSRSPARRSARFTRHRMPSVHAAGLSAGPLLRGRSQPPGAELRDASMDGYVRPWPGGDTGWPRKASATVGAGTPLN